MTMHTYLPRTNVFDPEAILTMSVAFELACADLQVFDGDERGREIIAKRIIDLARQGIMCPAALHHCVLADHPSGLLAVAAAPTRFQPPEPRRELA